MTLVNLTPHPINILDDANNVVQTLPPSGFVFRLTYEDAPQSPDVKGVIVSAQTVDFMKSTVEGDIEVYTVGAVVRDDAGAPLGVKNLVLN
jgi:hypothetical protein